jgi:hypothetical protein
LELDESKLIRYGWILILVFLIFWLSLFFQVWWLCLLKLM